jgi:uncharacterized Zn finger protein
MNLDETRIRDCCTDAVFDRGKTYREEGRIHHLSRVDATVRARVQGSRVYEVTYEPTGAEIETSCTCPYAGDGECKHVVAVLLEVAAESQRDERDPIEAHLDELPASELRSFVRDELARNPEMRERFRARFGDGLEKSVEEIRTEVDHLFDEHTIDSPVVVEAIDFSRFTDLAEEYRARGRYEDAARVYRGLAEGIEANMHLIDAAHSHYMETFQAALDGYVDCVREAEPSENELRRHVDVLAARRAEAVDYLVDRYTEALDALRSHRE